jgi:hypothetical protein
MEKVRRKSYNAANKIYFFTATIHKWQQLLAPNENKELIVSYLSLGSWHTKRNKLNSRLQKVSGFFAFVGSPSMPPPTPLLVCSKDKAGQAYQQQ